MMSPLDGGRLRRRIVAGAATVGTFVGSASPTAAEVCAAAGVDWLLLDLEHGSGGEEQVRDVIPAAGAYGVPTVVRVESGVTGAVRASMVHSRFEMTLRVVGSRGEAEIMDFVQPHKDDRVLVRAGTDLRTAHMGTRSSYIYHLEEFITALRSGWRMPTDPDDAVATAQLIDQCCRAAGLPLRPTKLALFPDVDQMI